MLARGWLFAAVLQLSSIPLEDKWKRRRKTLVIPHLGDLKNFLQRFRIFWTFLWFYCVLNRFLWHFYRNVWILLWLESHSTVFHFSISNFQTTVFCSKSIFQLIIVWGKSIFVYLLKLPTRPKALRLVHVHFLILMSQRGFVTRWWPEKRNKERRPPSQKMYFKNCKKHGNGGWNSPQMSHVHFGCLGRKFKYKHLVRLKKHSSLRSQRCKKRLFEWFSTTLFCRQKYVVKNLVNWQWQTESEKPLFFGFRCWHPVSFSFIDAMSTISFVNAFLESSLRKNWLGDI